MVRQKIKSVLKMQLKELLKTWNKEEILEALDESDEKDD